jgi:SprB repeat
MKTNFPNLRVLSPLVYLKLLLRDEVKNNLPNLVILFPLLSVKSFLNNPLFLKEFTLIKENIMINLGRLFFTSSIILFTNKIEIKKVAYCVFLLLTQSLIFAQNSAADLDQGKNGRATAPTPINWTNQNLNSNSSHYVEGYSVPYRMVVTGLSAGTHTLDIEWDIKNGGANAIDFITTFNRLEPHITQYGHAAEVIDPLLSTGLLPSVSVVTSAIPTPIVNSTVNTTGGLSQPITRFNLLPASEKLMTMYNGTAIVSMTYIANAQGVIGGNFAESQSACRMRITFTTSNAMVVFAWGGHIGTSIDWGAGNSAGGISGSPYHTRLIALDGGGGNQDRSLSAGAVCSPPIAAIAGDNNICSGTSTTLTATPTGTYTYKWSTVSGSVATPIAEATNSTLTTSPTVTTTYRVTTSNGGCDGIADYLVTVNPLPTADALASPALCFGSNGSVNLTVNSGTPLYTYLWSNTATTEDLASVPIGTYSVVVTDSKGCKANTSSLVTQPTALVASSSAVTIACNGGTTTVTVTATGGTFPYTGTGSFDKLAGTHIFTVTDANGCTTTTSCEIKQPTKLVASCTAIDAKCFGGQGNITVSATGGTSPYSGTGSFDLIAGTHTFTVTDANGCTTTTSCEIKQPTKLEASCKAIDAKCFGGQGNISVSATGGTSPYSGTGSFDLIAGTYSYTVTDANGCTTTTSCEIKQPTKLEASCKAIDAKCFGGQGNITVSATGGTSPYSGTGSFDLIAGTYSYTVTDAGCTTTTSCEIKQPTKLEASCKAIDAKCFGGQGNITVSATGGTSPYSGTGSFDLIAGTYSYTVTDANGCTATTSCEIKQPTKLVASSSAGTIACNGWTTTVTVTATSGTAPYTGAGSFTVSAGAYSYTVTDKNGCTSVATGTVTQPTALLCSVPTPTTSPTCSTTGNILTGTISGGTALYTCTAAFDAAGTTAGWSVNNCSITAGVISLTYTAGGVANTVLTVTIIDANGCVSKCQVVLTCQGIQKACSPGFWKNHTEIWDTQSDYVVANMPGVLTNPLTLKGTFVSKTNFWAYFGIPVNKCSISNDPNLTMEQALGLGGGNCIALTRHAVAALLGAAAFPNEFPYPFPRRGGTNADYTYLYDQIKGAFSTCNCGSLATTLGAISTLDGPFCGALQQLPQVLTPRSNEGDPKAVVTVSDIFVKAFPNPFSDEINFNFISPVSGQASLEIYDMVGRKLSVVYTGKVEAHRTQSATYKVSEMPPIPMVYKFMVEGKTVVGKLIPIQ